MEQLIGQLVGVGALVFFVVLTIGGFLREPEDPVDARMRKYVDRGGER